MFLPPRKVQPITQSFAPKEIVIKFKKKEKMAQLKRTVR